MRSIFDSCFGGIRSYRKWSKDVWYRVYLRRGAGFNADFEYWARGAAFRDSESELLATEDWRPAESAAHAAGSVSR